MSNRLITIIIPVRNGMNYLPEALESLRRQEMDIEVVAVDDGSTDATAEFARQHGCKVLSHGTSRGQVAAKNTGLREASGDYVMFMDHDDVMRPGALRALYDALEASPDVAAVMAKVQDFLSPDAGPMPGTVVRPDAYYGLFTGAVLMRKAAMDTIGPFTESLHTGEIIEWQTRMDANHLQVRRIDVVSTDRRIHRTNFGRTDGKVEFKDYAAVLRERLRRMKQQ